MTWRQMPAALKADGLTAVEKLVLVALVHFADQRGQNSYPSQQTLADLCNCSTATIKRAMRKLRKMELISPTGKGRKGTIRYTVNLPLSKSTRSKEVSQMTPVGGHPRPTIHCNKPLYKEERGTIVIDRLSDLSPMASIDRAIKRDRRG